MFDETEPLPAGTVLLEASAGTGKTHTITTLVLRLLVEDGLEIDQLVVVTFTRAAAAELRGRIRSRIHRATVLLERLVVEAVDLEEVRDRDPVVAHLAERHDVAECLRRLRVARERFDEGTIDTIHGFCQRVLQQSGTQLGVDASSELRDDVHDLVRSVVDDLLVRELRGASVEWYRTVTQSVPRRDLAATLTDVVKDLAGRPYLRVFPDDDRTPQQVWDDLCNRFREAWVRESPGLVDWLTRTQAERGFGGKHTYRPADLQTARVALDRWCDRPVPALGGTLPPPKALTAVSRAEVERCIEDRSAIPDDVEVLDLSGELANAGALAATSFVRRFARDAVDELERRTRDAGLWTFDDLLLGLDRGLQDPTRRELVVQTMRSRFSAALIDEFQDTDPVQWHIFSTLFGGSGGRLFLIGDPKQAIYAFRGADIHTYLEAVAGTATEARRTLDTNHRSDQPYLDAVERLFDRDDLEPDGAFAVPDIRFRRVHASEDHSSSGIDLPDGRRPALEIRVLPRTLFDVEDGAPVALGPLRALLPDHVAGEIDAFLRSGARIRDSRVGADTDTHADPDGHAEAEAQADAHADARAEDGSPRRPVTAGDVAILTGTRRQASQLQDALRARGVPAVIGSDDSVLDTPEAVAVERLLAAMLAPTDDRAVRTAAAGPVVGVPAVRLLTDGDPDQQDDAWDGLVADVARWGRVWRERGVAAALRLTMAERDTAARLLLQRRGERAVTNLVHLIEILHVEETTSVRGPESLVEWLAGQRHRPDSRSDAVELRLEDDADAVQIVTVHRAKGLQYPVVWCPYLWDDGVDRAAEWPVTFDDGSGRGVDLDLGRSSPTRRERVGIARRAAWEQQLRLAYVALTRARHRCVVHVGPTPNLRQSPLGRLLFGLGPVVGDGGGLEFDPDPARLADAVLRATLDDVAGDAVEVSEVGPVEPPRPRTSDGGDVADLEVRRLDRALDTAWQRTSFSRLVQETPDSIAGEARDDTRDATPGETRGEAREEARDETGRDHDQGLADLAVAVDTVDDQPPVDLPQVPLADLPRGADLGTLVHGVLERLDFRRATDPQVVADVLRGAPGSALLDEPQRRVLGEGLAAVVTTPLGPLAGGACLADLDPADRLDELAFDLPIAGGDTPHGSPVDVHRIADVFDAHAESHDAPLARAAARLRARTALPARGFLTGSIDLVARFGGRYLIADHKSNWLGEVDGRGRRTSTVAHHAPERMMDQMVGHDYLVQLHLYVVALHRFLRWRIPDHDYDRDVAGAVYLFLRGMTGPGGPVGPDGTPYGVCAIRPERALVEDLDLVLRGGA